MLPTAFLSLSGHDDVFVSRVAANLPDALAHFYPRTFSNGESLLEAMEERVGQSSVFALFASKKSLESVWVRFEIDRARIEKIKNRNLRILVFTIDPAVTFSDFPEWMKEYWIPGAGHTARDVARYIRNVLIDLAVSSSALGAPVGRGGFVDGAVGQLRNRYLTTKSMPNVFVFSGHNGIGRKTVQRKFVAEGFPAKRDLSYGPEIQLPQFADSADLYRGLRQEIEPQFSLSGFQESMAVFQALEPDAQADELAASLSYFGQLGQAVTISTGNGIYEDRGILKPWVSRLFTALARRADTTLFIVATRLIHVNELEPHPNVLQFSVPALTEEHIKTLIIATAEALAIAPVLPNDDVIRAIGGHAGVAKTATHLIAQSGVQAVNDNMQDLFRIQDQVLKESLSFEKLDEVEKDILSVLSWVPMINGVLLRDIILDVHDIGAEKFAEIVGSLALSCLLTVSGANYTISSPIRSMFRRLHGYGSTTLQKSTTKALQTEWQRRTAADEFPTELFDAFVYMISLEGGSLPPEMRSLLLASTLQEVVKDSYDNGHEDDAIMRRVVTWGFPAKSMKMDETVREEILSYVVRAQTRLQDHAGANELLDFFDSKGYRSAYYLRAFYIRHTGGDLKTAIGLLQKARGIRKYQRRVINDLALCYQKLGWWKELEQLMSEEDNIDANQEILDIKVALLLSRNRYPEAEDAIRKLRGLPREGGRADSRYAMLIMKRDNNFSEAKRLLTEALHKSSGGKLAIRRLRAIAAVGDGDFGLAKQDIEFLRPRAAGEDTALRIEARIADAKHLYADAEALLDRVKSVTGQDHLLRARILDHRAHDTREGLAERAAYAKRAEALRVAHRAHNEFEVDY